MIDPEFSNINRLFVFYRLFVVCYYIPLVEMKDFVPLIDNKPFFDESVKNKQEAYEKRVEMSRNEDCKKGYLLDYSYHQNYHWHRFIKTTEYKHSSTN